MYKSNLIVLNLLQSECVTDVYYDCDSQYIQLSSLFTNSTKLGIFFFHDMSKEEFLLHAQSFLEDFVVEVWCFWVS